MRKPSGHTEDCGVGRMEETLLRCRVRWKPFPCLLGSLVSPPSSLGGCFGLCLCWEGALVKAIRVINCCKPAFPVLGWKFRGWRGPCPPFGAEQAACPRVRIPKPLSLGCIFNRLQLLSPLGPLSAQTRGVSCPYQLEFGQGSWSCGRGEFLRGSLHRGSSSPPRPLRRPTALSPQVSDVVSAGKGFGWGIWG